MKQEKNHIERVFQNLGLKPALREKFGDYDIFYGDGFSKPPHLAWQKRREFQPGEFANGAFVTFWWIGKDDNLLIGRPLFFDLTEFSKAQRLNAARMDAEKVARRFRKLH